MGSRDRNYSSGRSGESERRILELAFEASYDAVLWIQWLRAPGMKRAVSRENNVSRSTGLREYRTQSRGDEPFR